MINLPISHNPPPSPARDAGAQAPRNEPTAMPSSAVDSPQRNTSSDNQASKGLQRVSGTASNNSDSSQIGDESQSMGGNTAGVVQPFFELLAEQIDGVGSDSNAKLQNISAFANNSMTDDTDTTDQKAIPADANGILATMLLQLPDLKDRGQIKVEHGTPLPTKGSALSKQVNEGDCQHATDKQQLAAALIFFSNEQAEQMRVTANSTSHSPINVGMPQSATPSTPAVVMHTISGANAANVAPTIVAPLGSDAWTGEFAQKISWMSSQQSQIAELHLNPPDLGPLEVVLKISGSQATALFTSPHGAVRDAVENSLPKLREILAENGITLGNATVSDQSTQNRGSDEGTRRSFDAAAQSTIHGEALSSQELLPTNTRDKTVLRHNGMVDIFA